MARGPKPLDERRSTTPPRSGLSRALGDDLGKLLDHVDGGVCVVENDAFLYANAQLLAMLGPSSLAELAARPVSVVVDAVDYEAWLNATPPNETHSQKWLRTDGRVVHLAVTASPVALADGEGFVVHVRDATSSERARRTDQLALIAALSAGISHQLNNPLAYVLANLNFLAEELPPFLRECAPSFDDEQHDLLSDMLGAIADAREGAERIARLVRSLRECSRTDDTQLGMVDVRSLLDTACATAVAELGERGRIVKQYESVALIEASATRLTQAFLALLRNAVQSSAEGSTTPLEIVVRTRLDASDGMVVVEVSDNGCGMGPAVQSRIFDPFYSRKPIDVATGLGLTMVLAVVHASNGLISVESEERVGSTFRLRFPVTTPRSSVREAGSGTTAPEMRQRLLIIDDELTLLSSLRRAIGSEADIELASSAEQAIELLSTRRSLRPRALRYHDARRDRNRAVRASRANASPTFATASSS